MSMLVQVVSNLLIAEQASVSWPPHSIGAPHRASPRRTHRSLTVSALGCLSKRVAAWSCQYGHAVTSPPQSACPRFKPRPRAARGYWISHPWGKEKQHEMGLCLDVEASPSGFSL